MQLSADPIAAWQSEKIYYSSPEYFRDLIQHLNQARTSIELETYIFACDDLGLSVLQALVSAAQRGVRVRVMVDGIGAYWDIAKITSTLKTSPVQVKIYHHFLFATRTSWSWQGLNTLLRGFAQLNRRLHRKTILIDHNILFLGSFNISGKAHRESGVCVTGTNVLKVLAAFESIWQRRVYQRRLHLSNQSPFVRLNSTHKLRQHNNRDLANRIRAANHRIWITNAYFVPPLFTLNAILCAGENGIDVQILTPARSDHLFMKLLTESYYQQLLRSGVRLFEYHRDFLHAKTLLIDDWALIGSSNMNHRSLLHDLEVDVVLTQPSSLQSLESQFKLDLNSAHEIKLEHLASRRFLDRVFSWLLYSLRYWL